MIQGQYIYNLNRNITFLYWSDDNYMEKRDKLMRTCTVCGLQKPLAAFLQISGAQGTLYGSICATCRGSGAKEKSAKLHDEEHGSTSSGFRIGSKEKVFIEKEKKRIYGETTEKNLDELKKRDKTAVEKFERTTNIEKAEKKHRETFLEAKKRGYLDYQTKKTPLVQSTAIRQEGRAPSSTPQQLDEQQAIEVKKIEDALLQELRVTTNVDPLSGAPIYDKQHHVISRDNPIFYQFLNSWLPADAPIKKTMSQLYKKFQLQGTPPQEKLHPQQNEKPILDYSKTGPASRKR